jgi:hypothetical protein
MAQFWLNRGGRALGRIFSPLLALGVFVCLGSPPGAFGQALITFGEGVPAPSKLSKQYCADPLINRGVEFFSNPRIVAAADVDGNPLGTASPPQMLLQSAAQEFSSLEVLVGSFTEGQSRVGASVGLDRDWGFPVTAVLRAFDDPDPGEGVKLTPDPDPSVTLGPGAAPVTTLLEFATPDGSASIRRVEIRFVGPADGQVAIEAIDDLTFSSIGPPCAADGAPPVVTILQPADGDALSSPEYLLHFSVSDDVGVSTLTVSALDEAGQVIETSVAPAPPGAFFERSFFTYALPGMKGLRIVATDFAGNTGEDTVGFDLQLPGPDMNLWVLALEVTQGLQHDVPVADQSRGRFATEAASDLGRASHRGQADDRAGLSGARRHKCAGHGRAGIAALFLDAGVESRVRHALRGWAADDRARQSGRDH